MSDSNHEYAARRVPQDEIAIQDSSIVDNTSNLRHHRNLIKYHERIKTRDSLWLIMDYCYEGTLERYLNETKPALPVKVDLMFQCVSAVKYMHSQIPPLVTGSLTPFDIFVTEEGGFPVVKLSSFPSSYKQHGEGSKQLMTYRQPEAAAATEADDIRSLGLLLNSCLQDDSTENAKKGIVDSYTVKFSLERLRELGVFLGGGLVFLFGYNRHFITCLLGEALILYFCEECSLTSGPSLVVVFHEQVFNFLSFYNANDQHIFICFALFKTVSEIRANLWIIN